MLKNIHAFYPVKFGVCLAIVVILYNVALLLELEMKKYNLQSFYEGIYFVIITMTTAGYGDIFPRTYIG